MKTDIFWDQLATEYGEDKVADVRRQSTTYLHYLLSRSWWGPSAHVMVVNEGGEESMIRAAACAALVAASVEVGLVDWSKELTSEYSSGKYRPESLDAGRIREVDVPPGFLSASAHPLGLGDNHKVTKTQQREPMRASLQEKLTKREYEIATTVASVGGHKEAAAILGMRGPAVSQALRQMRTRLERQGDLTYAEYRSKVGSEAAVLSNHARYHTVFPNPFCTHCKARPLA